MRPATSTPTPGMNRIRARGPRTQLRSRSSWMPGVTRCTRPETSRQASDRSAMFEPQSGMFAMADPNPANSPTR